MCEFGDCVVCEYWIGDVGCVLVVIVGLCGVCVFVECEDCD